MTIRHMLYALWEKYNHRFRGASAKGVETLGAIDNITPKQDGWLVIVAKPNAGISFSPLIRVDNRSSTIYEYTGIMSNATIMVASLPIIKGETYTINYFRCTKQDAYITYY